MPAHNERTGLYTAFFLLQKGVNWKTINLNLDRGRQPVREFRPRLGLPGITQTLLVHNIVEFKHYEIKTIIILHYNIIADSFKQQCYNITTKNEKLFSEML